MPPAAVEALMTWIIVGVILGGRLGFALFYQPGFYLANPGQLLRIWEGGMSFHGGLIGAALAGWIFARRQGVAPSVIGDSMAMVIPVGLGLGRIANFINAELWGQPTTQPWGVIFPGAGGLCPPDWIDVCARHPTQLYQAALEGVLLGLVMWWLVTRLRALQFRWLLTGVFLAGYAAARFTVEFWRVPDAQFLALHPQGHVLSLGDLGLTMGQVLSLPMLAIGVVIVLRAVRRGRA
jgi:phosphatidylglycerol---prolipoprotein diacylglyceryl transferase